MSAFSHFIINEWYFAVPMFLMSLAAMTLVVWRILLNFNANTNLNVFLPASRTSWTRKASTAPCVTAGPEPASSPSKLFVAGLETVQAGARAMRRAMANVIELEIVPDLNFLLAPILAIAKIATMVGLLGTVISMINTFSAISSETRRGGVTSHSKEIGLALFATALGLVTAIPLVFSHVLFKDWIAKYELKMQSAAKAPGHASKLQGRQRPAGDTERRPGPGRIDNGQIFPRLRRLADGGQSRLPGRSLRRGHGLASARPNRRRRPDSTAGAGDWQRVAEMPGLSALLPRRTEPVERHRRGLGTGRPGGAGPPSVPRR